MDRQIFLYCCILLIGVFISSISQVMLKKSAVRQYNSVIQEYLNPYVIVAYILFIGTTFLSILAYRVIPLSMGPIMETTSYIYVTYFGIRIFHEQISYKKILALALIISGILIYAVLG